MSLFRKAALTTAIVGAGLGSMSGAAFAHESAPSPVSSGDSCSNEIAAVNENGSGTSLGDTTGGDQDITAENFCNILSDNEILSGSNIATGASTIVDGDTITETSTEETTETGGGAGGGLPGGLGFEDLLALADLEALLGGLG